MPSSASSKKPRKVFAWREARGEREKGAWAEAYHFAIELQNASTKFLAYLEDVGAGSPALIEDAFRYADRARYAMNTAISIRLYRIEAARNQAIKKLKEKSK